MQVFVVGAARSGTTRIKTALSDALALPRSGEGHFYPIACDLDAALDGYFDRVCARGGPNTMIQTASREDLRRGIHASVRQVFDAVSGPSFVDKTPGAGPIKALPMVVGLWPQSKIVFAKRRGIENVMSALWKFKNWTFEASCRGWAEAMIAWFALPPAVKANSIEIDQAEMAREPERTAERLGAFLDLDDAATAVVAEAFTHLAHPRTNKRARSIEELRRDPIPLLETPWSEEQRAVFVTICGDMMRAYGYRLE